MLSLIPLPYRLAGLLLIGLALFAGGWKLGVDHVEAQQLHDERLVNDAVNAAQKGAATEIAKLEIKHVTLQSRIERETREVPVYRDCHHSPDGLLNLNAALTNAQPPGAGELPGDAGAATRR